MVAALGQAQRRKNGRLLHWQSAVPQGTVGSDPSQSLRQGNGHVGAQNTQNTDRHPSGIKPGLEGRAMAFVQFQLCSIALVG